MQLPACLGFTIALVGVRVNLSLISSRGCHSQMMSAAHL